MKYGTKLYYTNEQTDEVLQFKTSSKKIDKNYKYVNNDVIYRLWAFFTYIVLVVPIAYLFSHIFNKIKFFNKRVLKLHKKGGYFIYANHSNQFGDALCPTLICFPKRPYIIVNPVNLEISFLGRFFKMWGALPIPSTIEATKNFNSAIKHHLNKNKPILIYPEAHLWPYYTKIRNFPTSSFRYPIKFNKPVYTFTTVYKLKKLGKKPKIEIYVDGPFYADNSLPTKEAQQKLRNNIFSTMSNRSKNSNYEYVSYIKRSSND